MNHLELMKYHYTQKRQMEPRLCHHVQEKQKRETQLQSKVSPGKIQSVTLGLCNLVFLAQRHLHWGVTKCSINTQFGY